MVPTWSPPGLKNFFDTVQVSAHAVMYDCKVFLQYFPRKIILLQNHSNPDGLVTYNTYPPNLIKKFGKKYPRALMG
jgi:hypothetical protein